jgi:hypothetical protein
MRLSMAKRSNLKKEKALRNEAYARKFRRRANTGRFGKKRYGGMNSTKERRDNEEEMASDEAND